MRLCLAQSLALALMTRLHAVAAAEAAVAPLGCGVCMLLLCWPAIRQ